MKLFVFPFLLFSILVSCSTEPNVVHLKTVQGPRQEIKKVTPNSTAYVQISGMTCEMGCGGSIRMALKQTGAVDRVSFLDFNAEAKNNTAKITFDSKQISTSEIVANIEKLNQGQFKARITDSQK